MSSLNSVSTPQYLDSLFSSPGLSPSGIFVNFHRKFDPPEEEDEMVWERLKEWAAKLK